MEKRKYCMDGERKDLKGRELYRAFSANYRSIDLMF